MQNLNEDLDETVALGVLLWEVALADEKFLPQEEGRIREMLSSYSKISPQKLPQVLAWIKKASCEKIDLYSFTHKVSSNLTYKSKLEIVEELFRIAYADRELDDTELELIRKISELFYISHKDFIEAKIKIKKEVGLKTI